MRLRQGGAGGKKEIEGLMVGDELLALVAAHSRHFPLDSHLSETLL
jgi:hypothetical protein